MRIFLLVAFLAIVVWLLLVRPTPEQLRRYMIRGGLIAVAALLILAVATGRLNPVFALFGAMLPFANKLLVLLRYLPLAKTLHQRYRQFRGGGARPGNRSQVKTASLHMTLDHDSGEIDARVLRGPHQGARLAELELPELVTLYEHYCAQDPESAALLENYLDRLHGEDWRRNTRAEGGATTTSGTMSEAEALEVLGLSGQPAEPEIVAAHRRLMQKLHPDRGGSTYLAAKINQAKETLLKAA